MRFDEARARLSDLANGEYHALSYGETWYRDGGGEPECTVYMHEYGHYNGRTWRETWYRDGDGEPECSVYIHGYDHHSGRTWEEALDKLRDAMGERVEVDEAQRPGEPIESSVTDDEEDEA